MQAVAQIAKPTVAKNNVQRKVKPAVSVSSRSFLINKTNLQRKTEGDKKSTGLLPQNSRQTIIQPKADIHGYRPSLVQTQLVIGNSHDSCEAEANRVADQVVSIPDTALKPSLIPVKEETGIKKQSAYRRISSIPPPTISGKKISRQGAANAPSPALRAFNIEAKLNNSAGRGSPMDAATKAFMETRFGTDFTAVRIHTNTDAVRMSNALGARAFAYGRDVYFNRGEYQPTSLEGRRLLAHELTHVVQQGAAIQRKAIPAIAERPPPSVIQGLGIIDALNYIANRANNIPGFSLLTFVLGVNPVNMTPVPRTPANLFRGIIGLVPGGNLVYEALQNHGIVDRVGSWIIQKLSELGMAANLVRQGLDEFLDSLDFTDIFDLDGVWNRAIRIFTSPIDRIISFLGGLVSDIVRFIKEAILRPIAALAEGTRGYDLLKAVLGYDPVTGEAVPRTAETLIGGFMRLIGQEEIWENIKRGNAVARAWSWFQGALSGVMGFVQQIPSLFVTAFQSLQLADLILVPRAFARIASVFSGFIGSFMSWAGNTVWNLLEIIFSVVAPGVLPYLQRAAGAFRSILRNPIGFVGNLVRAAMQGFRQFAGNVLRHLRNSLIQWLTGALPGVYIPQALNLREIIKFVLSVLGLTWQNVRGKLVRSVGETAVRAMETGFEIVTVLVTQGPAAAWEKIRETLSNLQQMVIDGVMEFVQSRIVQAAVTRLVSMLSPAGAFIQAIIAIYNTVMFFTERLRQIAQVAASFIDSMSAIATGAIGAAANRVEQTMGGLLTLVISFLARIAGLGRVSDAVMNIINRVRQPIDRALDRVVEWIVSAARRLGRFVAQAGVPNDPAERLRLGMAAATAAMNRFAGRRAGAVVLNPVLAAMKVRYAFQVLEVIPQATHWAVRGQINPTAIAGTRVIVAREGENTTERTIVDPPKILVFQFRRFTGRQAVATNEMVEGLQHHQSALNALTVERWLANIYMRPFLRETAQREREAGRRQLLSQMENRIVQELKGRYPKPADIAESGYDNWIRTNYQSQIEGLIRIRSRGTHASHSADAIAGGNTDEFDSLERGAINSYVGSQWGLLRPELEAYATHLRQTIEPRERAAVRMNFRLRIQFLN